MEKAFKYVHGDSVNSKNKEIFMSVENLKKYIPSIDDNGSPYLLECKGGFVVQLKEVIEATSADRARLQAEITAISDRLLNNVRNTGSPTVIAEVSRECGLKLRQLLSDY
jgi:hypothetical protein